MSNKSIENKIQSLEEKLKAVNESRSREDTLSNNVGRNASPRAATSGPPRPSMIMPSKPRLRQQLDLQVPTYQPRSKDSIDTEHQLRDIKMRGILTTDGKQYQLHIEDLEQLGELGNGTCGHVVKMLHKPSGSVIAVKQMRRSGNSEENKRIKMDLDVVLQSHGCPYIVRYLGCFITEADVWICMELMASCFDKILKKLRGPVPEDILGKVTVATVKALSYLKEEHGVIHRDVKPSNILVDERGVIKLCDFGISGRLVDSKAKTRSAGCAAYMAPERIDPPDPQKPDYDIRADVWSLGISLVELATGIFPYRNCQNEFDILTKVIAEEPPMLPENQTFSPDFKNFVHSCLIKNYRHRPKYAALLADPFMQRASASDVRVDQWLASLNIASPTTPSAHQRSTTSPVVNHHSSSPPESVDQPPLSFHPQPLSPSSPLLNGSDKQLEGPTTLFLNQKKLSSASESSIKKSPTSPDERFTVESVPESTPPVTRDKFIKQIIEDRPTDVNHVKSDIVTEDCDSGSFGSMNIDDVTVISVENLSDVKHTEEVTEKSSRFRPIDKPHRRDMHRQYVFAGGNASDRSGLVPLVADPSGDRFRGRSFSNASADLDRDSHGRPHRFDRFAVGSPKNHFANIELRNQPSAGGFESRNQSSRGPDSGEFSSGGFHLYGSPEVHRRHFFPPCRLRDGDTENHVRRPVASPFQGGTESYENVPESRFSPPRFRTDAPTNYFTSTVCSVSRYFPPPVSGQMVGPAYHHNPGGSCSQPASLEAYGDGRHYPPYSHTRGPDKIHSPALWSPQPVARRNFHTAASREREERDRDRWRNNDSAHQHHQVQGNTSPIVLQRFYHQQSQRRSRRDVRDGSPHHSSLSREASVGRSPEPPRRLNRDRDASLSRIDIPCPADHPLSRERRERDRIPAETEGSSSLSEKDGRPDLIKPHRRHDRHSQDGRDNDCSMPSLESDRESLPPPARDRFHGHHKRERERKSERNGEIHRNDRDNDTSETEPIGLRERFELRSQKESGQLRRERERKSETNGDSHRSDREDNCDKESLSTARERFELRMQEKKNHKGAYNHHPRERDKTDQTDGGVCEKDGNVRIGPPQHRHGKSHSKDKDEQGWLNSIAGIVKRRFTSYVKLHLGVNNSGADRSTSPDRQHGGSISSASARSCRFPRRIAHSDCDSLTTDAGKRLQDCSHNFVPGFRYGGTAPMPPPRRGTESWSLPASPLPTRPT